MVSPLILLSNDDGIEAPGIVALSSALQGLGELWVVAPATEQSAQSHAFTMHEPLRILEREGPVSGRSFAVTGTPADAVYLACHHLLPRRPALVVSGINRGANLSTDVFYSRTVAAAREGTSMNIPALAVSLFLRSAGPLSGPPQWETAGRVARQLAAQILENGLPSGTLANVNVPNVPLEALKGLVVCPMGRRYYHPHVTVSMDPRGKKYYWIGGDHERFSDAPETDGPQCEAGFATLTPLQMDMTAWSFLDQARSIFTFDKTGA